MNAREIKIVVGVRYEQKLNVATNSLRILWMKLVHVEEDKFKEIQRSKMIPKVDARFLRDKKYYSDRNFCYIGPF